MSLKETVQSLDLESPVWLFELANPFVVGFPTYRFCNIGNVQFGGVIYNAVPCAIEIPSSSSEGSEPQVTMVVSDVDGGVAAILDNYGVLGATILVRQTYSIYLDSQPGSDPSQYQSYFLRINQYTGSYSDQFEFTCVPTVTLERKKVPARTYLRRCQWQLSDENCLARTDIHFDLAGNPTTPANRACAKDLRACRQYTNVARFGGYPAVSRRR